jgi:hypothetical protein
MSSLRNISNGLSYAGTKSVLVSDHDVDDIINGILYKHHKHKSDYDRISEKFWRGTPEATARCIFDCLKRDVKYRVETPNDQTVKSPGAIASQGVGDCKHYALFANGVLDSLQRKGYPIGNAVYRFAGYRPFDSSVHHVLSVLQTPAADYWIDPVLPTFNNRKMYFSHQDKSVKAMPLSEISGVDDQMGNFWDDLKHSFNVNLANAGKGIKTAAQSVAHGAQVNTANLTHAIKVNAANLPAAVKDVKNVVLKVNPLSVAGRNAFLALLKFNAFNMAHRLYDYIHANRANEQEVYNKWTNMGGDNNKIKTAITDGMRAYAYRSKFNLDEYNKQRGWSISGIPQMPQMTPQARQAVEVIVYRYPYYVGSLSDSGASSAIGMDPATAATLLTAAAAVIAAFSDIFKKAKWSDQDKQNAQTAANAGAQLLSNAAAVAPDGSIITTGNVMTQDGQVTPTLAATVTTSADGTKTIEMQPTNALDPKTQGGFTEQISQAWDSTKSFVLDNKMPLLFVLGGVVVLKSGIIQSFVSSGSTPKKRRK